MFAKPRAMDDWENQEILQAGENIEVKDEEEDLSQAFRVQLNSARDSDPVDCRPKEGRGRFKFHRYFLFAIPLFLILFITVSLLSSKLLETHFQTQILDESSPCTDFYSVVCKNKTATTLQYLEYYHTHEIIKLLSTNETDTTTDPGDAKEKARIFYQSCLVDCQAVKSHQSAPVENSKTNEPVETPVEDLDDPFVNAMLDKLANCSGLQGKLEYLQNELGLSTLFHWSVMPDLKDSNTNVLQITSVLAKQGEISPEMLSSLPEQLNKTFGLLFGNRLDESDKIEQLSSLVEMEMSMLTGMDYISNSDMLARYNPMTLDQLQKQVNMINWRQFFNNALQKAGQGQDKGVGPNDRILVENLAQLRDVDRIVTQLRLDYYYSNRMFYSIVDKFLVWQIIRLVGAPLWVPGECPIICKLETTRHFEYAVAALLLEKSPSFSPPGGWTPVFSAVREMAENIKTELIEMLENSTWHEDNGTTLMDSEKISLALVEKAKATRIKIGYPDFIEDPQQLNEYYAAIGNMNESNYVENWKRILTAKRVQNVKMFGKPVDRARWWTGEENGGITVVSGNAGNLMQFNEIVIPVGVLFRPLFGVNSTLAENYGALGMIIGHELLHGFAPKGLNFDKDGNYQNTTIRMAEQFSKCLVKQYSDFQYGDGSALNGTLTLDENVADNGGLRIAMRAFLHHLERQWSNVAGKDQTQESQDPHLQNLKELQVFFASFAGTWCGVEHATSSTTATGDSHSPGKFRVLGTLQNTREFAEAFSCPHQQSLSSECPAL